MALPHVIFTNWNSNERNRRALSFVFILFLNRQFSVKRTSAVYAVMASVFPFSHNCILSDRATTTTGMGREEREREGENLNWKKVNFCFTVLLIKKKKAIIPIVILMDF